MDVSVFARRARADAEPDVGAAPPRRGPGAGSQRRAEAPRFGALLAITITLALAAFLLLGSALAGAHASERPASWPGSMIQNQGAKTAALSARVRVDHAARARRSCPRLADADRGRDGHRECSRRWPTRWGWRWRAALVAVRLAPLRWYRDGLGRCSPASCCGGWPRPGSCSPRSSGRSLAARVGLARRQEAALATGALLALAVVLCLTDVNALDPLAPRAGRRARARGPRQARSRPDHADPPLPRGRAIDVLVVLAAAAGHPQRRRLPHSAGIPNAFFAPGIVQFQQDYLLGPTNQLLGGGALLVNVPVSQYGVGYIYFARRLVSPRRRSATARFGLLDGLRHRAVLRRGLRLLRVAGVARPGSPSARWPSRWWRFVYNLYYPVGVLPQQGPLRFGLPMAVILAPAAALRWPRRARIARALALLALGAAAVWSLEMLAYTLVTYARRAGVPRPGWRPATAAPAARAQLGLAVAACVGAHLVLAVCDPAGHRSAARLGAVPGLCRRARARQPGRRVRSATALPAGLPGLARRRGALASARAVVLLSGAPPAPCAARAGALRRPRRVSPPTRSRCSATATTAPRPICSPTSRCRAAGGGPVAEPAVARPGGRARGSPRRLALALAVAGVMLGGGWPAIGPPSPTSALAHAYPGGGLRGALPRLWHPPPIDPRAPAACAAGPLRPGRAGADPAPRPARPGDRDPDPQPPANSLFIGDPKADAFVDPTDLDRELSAEFARWARRAPAHRPRRAVIALSSAAAAAQLSARAPTSARTRRPSGSCSGSRGASRSAAGRRASAGGLAIAESAPGRAAPGAGGRSGLGGETTLWAAIARSRPASLDRALDPRRQAEHAPAA